MFNFNGKLINEDDKILDAKNRGLQLGDGVYEELRIVSGEVIFLEEHSFGKTTILGLWPLCGS
mgnify:CR=1 FL=1